MAEAATAVVAAKTVPVAEMVAAKMVPVAEWVERSTEGPTPSQPWIPSGPRQCPRTRVACHQNRCKPERRGG